MEAIIIKFVVHYIMSQFVQFEQKIDWATLEAQLDEHIEKFFPLKFMDDALVDLAHKAFGMAKAILSQDDQIQDIVTLLAEKKFPDALAALEALVLAQFQSVA